MAYEFIDQMREEFPIETLCKVLEISRSSYYEWWQGKTYQINYKNNMLEQRAIAVFWENKRRYGSRRIAAAVQHQELALSLYKARQILKRNGLKAIQPRSFVPKTTNSRHSYTMSPNLLKDKKMPCSINEVWVGDITYIPMTSGCFNYLSVWMDLYSRRIIGWSLKAHMQESLVIDSFKRARNFRRIKPGLLIHSDRGGQYAGNEFRRLLDSSKALQSMSDPTIHMTTRLWSHVLAGLKLNSCKEGRSRVLKMPK